MVKSGVDVAARVDADTVDMAALHAGRHISLSIADADIGGLAVVFLLGDIEIAVLAARDVVGAAHTGPRRAAARAYNIVTAEYFRPFADRMTPAAIIPMHTPEEAIEELEFAVKQLGYKVAMLGSLMDRPVAAAGDVEGEAKRFAVWKDVIGLDSDYNYDPVWAKCLEQLGAQLPGSVVPSGDHGVVLAGYAL